ncbi:hypothetical protein GCM10010522_31640 [Kribbella solani]
MHEPPGGELANVAATGDLDNPAPIAEPPKAGKMDTAAKLVAGAGGSAVPLPFVGGVLTTAFEMMADRGLNKRRDAWEQTVVAAINQLIEWNKAFADSDVLFTAVVKAGRIALATYQQEKLDALRNAVVNSVAPGAPADDEQARFFRLIDELTPSHIVMLRFLQSPGGALRQLPADQRPARFNIHIEMVMMGKVFEMVAPEIAANLEFRDLLVYDLSQARLALTFSSLDDLGMEESDDRTFATSLGARFLAFVSDNDQEPALKQPSNTAVPAPAG